MLHSFLTYSSYFLSAFVFKTWVSATCDGLLSQETQKCHAPFLLPDASHAGWRQRPLCVDLFPHNAHRICTDRDCQKFLHREDLAQCLDKRFKRTAKNFYLMLYTKIDNRVFIVLLWPCRYLDCLKLGCFFWKNKNHFDSFSEKF